MQMHGVFQPDRKVALLSWVNSHSIHMLLKKQPLEVRFEAQTRGKVCAAASYFGKDCDL